MIGVFEHPWLGGLFGDESASIIWSAERYLANMLAFEAAYSRALGAAGAVDSEMAGAAVALIEKFQPNIAGMRAGTAKDGLPVPALVAQILAGGVHLAPAIHKGATSQDVMDTALALSIRDTTSLLLSHIEKLGAQLDRLVEAFGANALMGRTRMQAAESIAVADRILAWRIPLGNHTDRLSRQRPSVERVQLGGPVGLFCRNDAKGAAFGSKIAQELGLHAPTDQWHTMRDGLVEYAGILSMITGAMGKIGQDICLMAQQGIDEITLSSGGGSSAMPHKSNPVLAELLVTLARFNAVQLSGMHQALVHEQERSGSAWALEWMILPQMAIAAARSLSAGATVCNQVSAMGTARRK